MPKLSVLIIVLVLFIMQMPVLKATSEEAIEVVFAKEILDKIEMGFPVEYEHIIVKGDLDLNSIDLPLKTTDRDNSYITFLDITETAKLVKSPIVITDSKIEGVLKLSNAVFEDQINFAGTSFINYTDFSRSQFSRCANFGGSVFFSYAYFNESQIDGYADFNASHFCEYANFWGSIFNNVTDFRSSRFSNYAGFTDSYFNNNIDFSLSQFDRYADYSGSKFNDYANFRGSYFNGYADFSRCNFDSIADFKLSKFNGYADFSRSNFNNIADFTRSKFNNLAYFAESCFNCTYFKEVYFNKEANFNDCRFKGITSYNSSQFKEDALFGDTTFYGELSLTRTRYDKLFIRWYSIKSITYDDSAYLSLLGNFKSLGYLEDHDYCYFEYRKAYRNQPWPLVEDKEEMLRKSIDLILEWLYGYGTKPFNVIYFSLGIIVIFGIFWGVLGLGGQNDETFLQSGQHRTNKGLLSIIEYSTTVFLSGTKLFVDPPAIPAIRERSQSILRRAFILQRVLGALLSILFFLAISGTIVRQVL